MTLLASLITFNKQQLFISIKDGLQYIMTLEPGFSSPRNLSDTGTGEFTELSIQGKLFHLVKAIPTIVKYKLLSTPESPQLERLDLDIKFVDLKTLMADRERAIKAGLLSDPTTVKADVRFRGQTYKAKIRLKGDRSGHWLSRYRVSFRVNIRKKKNILGFNKFSLQKPKNRAHPYDQTFQDLMRQAGNLSSVHKYVRVFVNGSDWGVMNMEEHVNKFFLEKLQRKESSIIRFKDERVWLYRMNSRDPYPGYRLSDPILNIRLYGSSKYLGQDIYRKWLTYISEQRMKSDHPHLYDVGSFSRAIMLARAWGEHHTLGYANSRFYLDPYTIRLEPITTDQLSYKILEGGPEQSSGEKLDLHYLQVMSTDAFKNDLHENIADVNQAVLGIQDILDKYNRFFPLDKPKNGQVVIDNMRKVMADPEKYLLNTGTLSRPKLEDHPLPSDEQAREFDVHLYVRHYEDGKLQLYNLLPDTVQVKQVLLNGEPVVDGVVSVPGYVKGTYIPVTLDTGQMGVHDGQFTVVTEYRGNIREVKNGATLLVNGMLNPLLAETPRKVKYLKEVGKGYWEIPEGKWFVDGPLTVAGHLKIMAGARLQFSEDAYLIVKGNLTAQAPRDNPIVLEPAEVSWKGIYVLEGRGKSELRNVIFRMTSGLQDGLLVLTGGVTFYKTDVDFEDVRFEGTLAEDALNLVKSSFTIKNLEVVNAVSDGIDFDFSRGTVTASKFSDIGGDSLDFSGSTVDISKVTARRVKDKVVSVGEASFVNVTNSDFSDVGVGIASKDGSHAKVENVSISDYGLHAAMTYIKKDFYDTPVLELMRCDIGKGNAFSRQKGTRMRVDDAEVEEVLTNVKALYQSGVMKK